MNIRNFLIGLLLIVLGLGTYFASLYSFVYIIAAALFLTVGIVLLFSSFKSKPQTETQNDETSNYRPIPEGIQPPYKSRSLAAFLCLFLGLFGIHMFYIGRPGRGIIYAIINILLFRTWIIPLAMAVVCICDLINILTGKELDCYGRPLI